MEAKSKKTILIVEDEAIVRKSLAEELHFQGFNVLEAGDGKEGLRLAFDKKPDLILLDISMPVMNGLDVIRELRKNDWGKKVPVIFVTQLAADDKIMKEIILSEPSYYLMKADWNTGDVVKKVKETLEWEANPNELK